MITTNFPERPWSQLKRVAERHAFEVDCAYDRIGASDDVPTDRLVVNYLRHVCTDYDEDQSIERHREACEAIAQRYPYLAGECQRQIERRREESEIVPPDPVEWEREERRARVEESKQRIADLSVGQAVWFKRYKATVTKIGRSKVTVAYEIETGKDRARSKTVHAAFVTPVEDGLTGR